MSLQITASVGASGQNRRPDVETIQLLLVQQGMNPGPVDGLCGPGTVGAILDFQAGFLPHPDGRVDPNGTTWQHLISGNQPEISPQRPASPDTTPSVSPSASTQILTATVPLPSRDSINPGLLAVSQAFMVQQLGQPRESYSADCQPITNATLRRYILTQSVGPFRVTGLQPAVASLATALAQVQREQPSVYAALGTAGLLCCRYVRGSKGTISNHSWGTAIDFTLNGVLDLRGDNRVQIGLTLLASIMNQHGWYWGAAFRTEDAMHFEASQSLITQWAPQLR